MSTVHFDSKGKEIFALIDSNALIHRAYHAYPSTLATAAGEQVNAVYGFASMLFNVFETVRPTYIACAFDLPKPTFRHLEYVGYKKDRPEVDEDMKPQFDRVRQVVEALNIPIFAVEGYEADDVIGTLCRQIDELDKKKQVNTIIVTGDKDALQLVDANTKVWLPGKTFKDMKLYGIDEVKERFGLKPKQIIDLKALAGDPSDQIPGVYGIGNKGAETLLQSYETIEDIYKNIDSVPTRYRQKLIDGEQSATMSKKLATIITDVPIKLDYESAVLVDYDKDRVINLFRELQFRSLINKLPKSSRQSKEETQMMMFSMATEQKTSFDVEFVKESADITKFFDHLEQSKSFATSVFVNENNKFVGFDIGDDKSYVVSIEDLSKDENLLAFKKLFEDKDKVKIGYDVKLLMHELDDLNINIKAPFFDISIAGFLLGYGGGNLSLESLSFSLAGISLGDAKNLSSDSESVTYTGLCAKALFRLFEKFQKDLSTVDAGAGKVWRELVEGGFEKLLTLPDYRIGVKDLFNQVEMPLVTILHDMEKNGILINKDSLYGLKEKFTKKITEIEKEIYDIVGHEFNISSSRQLADILFEELKLPPVKKTKTGYSTASNVLAELKGIHPIIEPIEEYRELTKLVSTYVDGLIPLIKDDGKIHTTYNQAVAVTGRLSSSNPNLQNIPVRTGTGNLIRECFVAPKDGVFVAIDYSQIELRLASHVAGEDKMLAAFANNEDIHAATASEIFEIPIAEVDKTKRRIAKTVNFAVLYGVSPYGLSQQMDSTPEEAASVIDRYFEKYPKIHNYIDRVIDLAKKYGYLESMFGRKASVKNINSSNFALRKATERFSINFPMQSSASDVMKIAMIDAASSLQKFLNENEDVDVKMLLQIHDEIVFEYSEKRKSREDLFSGGEIRSEKLKKFASLMKSVMEDVVTLSVKMAVGVEIGGNLGNLEEISL